MRRLLREPVIGVVGPGTNPPVIVWDGTEPLGSAPYQPLIALGPGPFEMVPGTLSLHMPDPSPEELWTAVIALSGGLFVSAGTAIRPDARDTAHPAPTLTNRVIAVTEREQEVLDCVARGLPNKGIAVELDISIGTVKFHLANLMAKLVMEAARQGYLIV